MCDFEEEMAASSCYTATSFTLTPAPELASGLQRHANPNLDDSPTIFFVGLFERAVSSENLQTSHIQLSNQTVQTTFAPAVVHWRCHVAALIWDLSTSAPKEP